MCLKEYLIQQLSVFGEGFSEALLVAEINALGESEDSLLNAHTQALAKEVLYKVIPLLLLQPQSVSEGGYTIQYDKAGLKAYYALLAKQLGKEDTLTPTPILTDITPQW